MEGNFKYKNKTHTIDIQDVSLVVLDDSLHVDACDDIREQYDSYTLLSTLYNMQYDCNEEILNNSINDLLSNYNINSESIIVLNNPENDLHPRKQVEFIKKLFELKDKCKCKVLVFINSPFILKACIYYSSKYYIDTLKIYTEENGDIIDVSDTRDKAFKSLTECYLDLREDT